MDWKNKRSVLYQKGKTVDEPPKAKSQPAKQSKKEPPLETIPTSAGLYKWLETHSLINLNGLCKKVGYDRANFVNGKAAGKEIRAELLIKFIDVLKPYGYAE